MAAFSFLLLTESVFGPGDFIRPLEEIAPTLGTLEEEPTWVFLGVGQGHDQRSLAETFHLFER